VFEAKINAFTDNAEILGYRRTNEFWGQFENGILIEPGCQPIAWELDPIPLHPGKPDLEIVAFWAHSPDLYDFARGLRRRDNRLRCEIEWDAQHVGVFNSKEPFLVEVV
jgi:hypothetical protein